MALQFEEKGLPKVDYQDDLHPLYIYLQRNIQTRSDVILNHLDVLGFVYFYKGVIRKAFFVNKKIDFKATGVEKRNSIIAVSDATKDYIP